MKDYIKSMQNRTSVLLLLCSLIMLVELIWEVKIRDIGVGIIAFTVAFSAIMSNVIIMQIAEDCGLYNQGEDDND